MSSTTTVINIKTGAPYDIYIGRPSDGTLMHYGNPFTYREGTKALINVGSRRNALEACGQWLDGAAWEHVEQERRQWVLKNLPRLAGKRLGCFCAPDACHGDLYVRRLPRPAPWALDPADETCAYWAVEVALGSIALERLQRICAHHGYSYDATVEALSSRLAARRVGR